MGTFDAEVGGVEPHTRLGVPHVYQAVVHAGGHQPLTPPQYYFINNFKRKQPRRNRDCFGTFEYVSLPDKQL